MSTLADPAAELTVLSAAFAQPHLMPTMVELDADVFTTVISQSIHRALVEAFLADDPRDHATIGRRAAQGAATTDQSAAITRTVLNMIGQGEFLSPGFYLERLRRLRNARLVSSTGTRLLQIAEEAAERDDSDHLADGTSWALNELSGVTTTTQVTDADLPMSLTELLGKEFTHDWLVPDLIERGDRIILTGLEGTGKALALDTPVPTPNGWSTMGALKVGDSVFHADGTPVKIIAATEVLHGRPCYEVTFSDGAKIVADENHLWLTEDLRSREASAKSRRRGPLKPRGTDQSHKRKHWPTVRTTGELADSVYARGGHTLNHSIAVAKPLQYPTTDLLIDPYVMGAWLGDGTSSSAGFTCAESDSEIIDHIRNAGYSVHRTNTAYGWCITRREQFAAAKAEAVRLVEAGLSRRAAARATGISSHTVPLPPMVHRSGWKLTPDVVSVPRIRSFQEELRDVGVLGNKHIPESYLHSGVEQRLALLQGLMDTDGTITGKPGNGRGTGVACEFSVVSKQLASDFHELVLGLGIKAVMRESPATLNGRVVGTRYRILFQTELPVFRLQRKLERMSPLRTERPRLRYVVSVEKVESVPVRCIQVEREDGLFLAGRECIVTHNSYLVAQVAMCIAAGIHPFLGVPVTGHKQVLVIDAENSERQTSRRYQSFRKRMDTICAARGVEAPDWSKMLRFVIRPEGIPLNNPNTLARIERAIAATRPEFVAIGPLYRLHRLDTRDEQAAKELTDVIDRLRVKYRFAVICEAHVAHGQQGQQRALRPTGSSLFLRWPEFGFGLRPAQGTEREEHPSRVDLATWRGGREERLWPRTLQHGHEETQLPWNNGDDTYLNRARARGINV